MPAEAAPPRVRQPERRPPQLPALHAAAAPAPFTPKTSAPPLDLSLPPARRPSPRRAPAFTAATRGPSARKAR